MDQSAIHAIRSMATAEQANALLHGIHELSPVVIVPENYKIADLEKYAQLPERFRGQFTTRYLEEFVSYINEKGTTRTGIFIDPENDYAKAILNMGSETNPEWGDHLASLNLTKTPEFLKLIINDGKTLSQQDLIDFAEDWQSNIEFISDQEENLDFRSSINAIRRLTVSATQSNESIQGNFNASQSSLDAIEVKAAGAILPFGFIFTCTPYESFNEINCLCQLRALTDGKTVNLKYRIMVMDRLIYKIGVEFKELLKKSITIDAGFYTGTMDYQPRR